jgi:hypothetical protein
MKPLSPDDRWTVMESVAIARLNEFVAKSWFADEVISGEMGEINGGRGRYGTRRLDYPALLHLALVDRLWRSGITPRHASKMVALFIDRDAKHATYDKGTSRRRAGARLATMILRIRIGHDDVRHECVCQGKRHKKSGPPLPGDYVTEINVGKIAKDLCGEIEKWRLRKRRTARDAPASRSLVCSAPTGYHIALIDQHRGAWLDDVCCDLSSRDH